MECFENFYNNFFYVNIIGTIIQDQVFVEICLLQIEKSYRLRQKKKR